MDSLFDRSSSLRLWLRPVGLHCLRPVELHCLRLQPVVKAFRHVLPQWRWRARIGGAAAMETYSPLLLISTGMTTCEDLDAQMQHACVTKPVASANKLQ